MNLRNIFPNLQTRTRTVSGENRRTSGLQLDSGTINTLPFGLPLLAVEHRNSPRREPEHFNLIDSRTRLAHTIALAIQQPRVRNTKWHLGGRHHDRVLSLPAMLFFVCFYRGGFQNVYAFFLVGGYSGPFTKLYHSILPNSNESGWICMGNGETRDAITQETLRHAGTEAKINTVLTAFWQGSYFNTDWMSRFSDHAPRLHRDLASIAAWERASRLRPGFIRNVPWRFATTVGAVLQHLGGGR